MASTTPGLGTPTKPLPGLVPLPPAHLHPQRKYTINLSDLAGGPLLPPLQPPAQLPVLGTPITKPHKDLDTVLNVVAQELTQQIDTYLDTVSVTLTSSAFALATALNSKSHSGSALASQAELQQQVKTGVQAMVASCRAALVPWLRAGLTDYAEYLCTGKTSNTHTSVQIYPPVSSATSVGTGNQIETSSTSSKISDSSQQKDKRNSQRDARSTSIMSKDKLKTSKESKDNETEPETKQTDSQQSQQQQQQQQQQVDPYSYRGCERLIKSGDTLTLQTILDEILMGAAPPPQPGPDGTTVPTDPEARLEAILGPQGKARNTLLHCAALAKRPDICRLLTSYGADPNAMNARNVSPMLAAVEQNDLPTVTALVEAGGRCTEDELKEIENRVAPNRIDQAVLDLAMSNLAGELASAASGEGDGENSGASGSQLKGKKTAVKFNPQRVFVPPVFEDETKTETAKMILASVPATKPPDATEAQVAKMIEKLVKYAELPTIKTFLESLTPAERAVQLGPRGKSRSNILFTLAWNRRSDLFEYFIDTYKIDVNYRNLRNNSAILMAVEQNHQPSVELLMQYGATITEREVRELENRTGKVIDPRILEAVRGRKPENDVGTVPKTTKRFAQVASQVSAAKPDVHRELERLVKHADPAKVRAFLDNLTPAARDAHLGPYGPSRSTILFTAAWNKRADICELLIEYQADVNHRNLRGNAAISMAIEQNDIDCVNVLLEYGADSSSAEVREIERRTGRQVDSKIPEAIFDWCSK